MVPLWPRHVSTFSSANRGVEEFWRCPHGKVWCERAALLLPVSTLVMAKTKCLLSFLSRCSLRQEGTTSLRDQTGLSAALLFTFGKTSPKRFGSFSISFCAVACFSPWCLFSLRRCNISSSCPTASLQHGEHARCSAAQTPLLHCSRRASVKEE